MKAFFVIDAESVGLHGEAFAVGGGVYLENGSPLWEFCVSCPISECAGDDEDREWVKQNVPFISETHRTPKAMRDRVWELWMRAKNECGAVMAADCQWPVEAGLIKACIADDPSRKWQGPYPFHEIASYLQAAGLDPMEQFPRTESEKPAHHPLHDARQSARLLSEAIAKLSPQTK